MKSTLILLIILFSIILAILIILEIIYFKIKKLIGFENYKQMINAIREARNNKKNQEIPRSISGMTAIYEPKILEDFPDFNKEILYSKIEANMLKIYNMYENKNYIKDKDLQLLQESLKENIADIDKQKKSVHYDNIHFHKHAIKSYIKEDGIATVKISSALEYEYSEEIDQHTKDKMKKQIYLLSTFIYVYDVYKIKDDQPIYFCSCPNCGAPLRHLKDMTCEYCMTAIDEVNMKIWLMSSYKEE